MRFSDRESSAIGRTLSKWRWFVMAWISLLAILLQFLEKANVQHPITIDPEFISAILLEGIIIPLSGVALLTILQKTIVREIQTAHNLSKKEALSRLVNTVPDWNKLLRVIVEFPREIISLSGSALVIYDPDSRQYETAEIWGFYYRQVPVSLLTISKQVCAACQASRSDTQLYTCKCEIPPDTAEPLVQYCLPLIHGGRQEAMLYLFVTPDMRITAEQEALLNSLALEMALALVAARSTQTNQKLKEKTDAERRQIARDLHDNIAQSLIYLRNKLDTMVDTEGSIQKHDIQPDLERMRDVTEDVYITLRSLLKEIDGKTLVDLNKMISDYLQTMQPRVGFDIHFIKNGEFPQLEMRSARQVLNIIGELLANIEKHAEAQSVEVEMSRNQAGLTIAVCDDGKGFDGLVMAPEGHMGLAIIHERAAELKGKLEIKSKPESGTEAVLWLPLNFA